jgi:hypothetical protein
MEVKLTLASLPLPAAAHQLRHRGLLSYGCTGHRLLMIQVLRYAKVYVQPLQLCTDSCLVVQYTDTDHDSYCQRQVAVEL